MDVNQKELAATIGITPRRVRELKQEGFFETIPGSRKYDLAKCVQEYIEYKVKAETRNGKSMDKEEAQAKHESIKMEISILKLRRLKRELHEARDVEFFLSNMLINFKNKLLSIPSKVSIQIVGEKDVNKIIAVLNKEVMEALEELSEYNPDEIEGEILEEYYEDEEEAEEGEE